jgi:hypothetical protein
MMIRFFRKLTKILFEFSCKDVIIFDPYEPKLTWSDKFQYDPVEKKLAQDNQKWLNLVSRMEDIN